MKIREISQNLNEGILDSLKGAWRGMKAGYTGSAQQRAGQQFTKGIADRVFDTWNQYLVNLPPGTDPNQTIENFMDKQFHEVGPSQLQPALSNVKDAGRARDYINKRTQEYVAQRMAATSRPKSQLPAPAAATDSTKGPEPITIAGQRLDPSDPLATRVYNIIGGNVKQPTSVSPTVSTATPTAVDPFAARRAAAARPARAAMSSKKPLPGKKRVAESTQLKEGGNAIPDSQPVPREDVAQVVELAKRALPKELLANLQGHIGSAGYKIASGDIDLMVEAQDVVDLFGTGNLPDPVKAAKILLKKHFEEQGIVANVNGRNVSIGVVYTQQASKQKSVGQLDVMVIHEAAIVAPWHQHGLRGMYNKPDFKGNEIFILISSIAKQLGLKFDPFAAKLIDRNTGDVVGRTRKEVAKILLGPKAKEDDLNSVGTILKALEFDADREGKLAQAKQDAAKGLIRLPENAPFNTAAYYRKISDIVA